MDNNNLSAAVSEKQTSNGENPEDELEPPTSTTVLTSTPLRTNAHAALDASDVACDVTAVERAGDPPMFDVGDATDTSTLSNGKNSPSRSSTPHTHLPRVESGSDVTSSTCHELSASHNSGTQTDDDVTGLHETLRAPILGFEVMEERARFTVS